MSEKKNLGAILAIYLLGLFLGGVYVGIVGPMRTVIQEDFLINDVTGIWVINIYTLFYAAFIPIIGSIADNHGRKPIFLICLATFALGSLFCAVSPAVNNFPLLLAGRVIQAIGACGIIPVANAEIGTTFPAEKRGMALGMAAAVTGLSNIFGAAIGSVVTEFLGNESWPVLFYAVIPVAIVIMAASIKLLPNTITKKGKKLDIPGSILFVVFVLALLLSFRAINVFDLAASIVNIEVWLPLLVAILCLLVFGCVERKVENPVFHMEYLNSRPIVITMVVSFFIGCVIISMQLIPEFCEVITGARTGSGGYYILVIGIFSLFGPPLAGKLIDKIGPKPVLIGGMTVSALGYLFLAIVGTANPTVWVLVLGLGIVGLGMGFSMGAPTNYMILENTKDEESTSAIATITLIRQIGTSLAPAILVGFIVNNAGVMGYEQMLLCVTAFSVIGVVLMLFYKSPKR